jgi:hypothetical protein
MSDLDDDSAMSGIEEMPIEEEVPVEKKQSPSKKRKLIALFYYYSSLGYKSTTAESHVELLKQAVISRDSEKFFTVIRNLHPDMKSKRLTIQELDASMVLPTINYINHLFRDDKLRER